MHAGQFPFVGRLHEQIHTLALIDEHASVGCHIDDVLHAQFPHGFVQLFDVGWNALDLLNGAVVPHDLILEILVPKPEVHKVHQ